MAHAFGPWSLFLHLLIINLCTHGIGAREMVEEHWKELTNPQEKIIQKFLIQEDQKNVLQLPMEDHHVHHPSHKNHMDPSLLVFFTLDELKEGQGMPIYFPKRDPSSSPHFSLREGAESIPFSLSQLPKLLQFFSFSPSSPQARAMEDTLRECETKPINGETKICATSLESMLDFTKTILGKETQSEALSTTHLTKSSTLLQNYTILKVSREVPAPKIVACHTMPYPYAVFYCHSHGSKSMVFKVLVQGENGDRVDAVVVCHLDTSQWGRGHVSFRVLRIEPGTSPVCHFFPADNLVWVPTLL
ncbi:BURP domain-containing protein BNM2A-like [Malania oleifera]|uniref:BURP domain-containing protein BNM2A-like n=1 Tax=Malania oleifera TaxID=397392 RepID=UPI0025ADEF38|nr:BURP domain-containing protein BNM2A-like [Malania oleifera]